MKRISIVSWTLLGILALAVAGITHIATLLIIPWRSPSDAFARVSTMTPSNPRALLPVPGAANDRLPIRDPAMLTAVCRFDLDTGPFRLATSPFANGFVTVGFHGRHGVAFYGLTVQASDASSLDLVLGKTADPRVGSAENGQVAVAAPEPSGFVTLSTPIDGDSGRAEAEQRLDHFRCLNDPPPA